ncbi:MAG: hypothetical protein FJX29_11660, partial [Alphaproteobacteria bacterium]|nr:hypothetical protein [Alphaproteobacteria bacterium]
MFKLKFSQAASSSAAAAAPPLQRRSRCAALVQRAVFAAGLACTLAITPVTQALAQGRISLIRDAEIEQLIRDYANPLLKAARVNAGATKIYLIGDRRFNAFVAEGRNIFINTGAIMEAETPNELIGVLAHEIGHIAGGHLVRQRMQLDRAAI